MNRIWAPWRMTYILAADEVPDACIFCQYPAEEPSHHRDRLILCADERAFVIMNKYPYSGGHLLVVPRAHVSNPADLSTEDYHATMDLLRVATERVRQALSPHGFNLGMNLGRVAGAGIDKHCHWHIVPRWNGDTNFMPVIGDAKVVSDHLQTTYDRLLPYFAASEAVSG
ncbi:MAG TPA: HIT domain-containing protein [Polyangia bacterium]|jgi:ATP adenylyltransferase|nr:HIT domain-containing protein [Polyangia bacterium]